MGGGCGVGGCGGGVGVEDVVDYVDDAVGDEDVGEDYLGGGKRVRVSWWLSEEERGSAGVSNDNRIGRGMEIERTGEQDNGRGTKEDYLPLHY